MKVVLRIFECFTKVIKILLIHPWKYAIYVTIVSVKSYVILVVEADGGL